MRPLPYPLRFTRKIKQLLGLRSGEFSGTWVQILSGTPSFPTTYQPTSRKLLESESSSDRALHGSIALIRNVFEVDVLAEHLGHECVPREDSPLRQSGPRTNSCLHAEPSTYSHIREAPRVLQHLYFQVALLVDLELAGRKQRSGVLLFVRSQDHFNAR